MNKLISLGLCLCIMALPLTVFAQGNIEKKAVFIIPQENYQDDEFAKPLDILMAKGIKVTIASTTIAYATGMNGGKTKPDMLVRDIKVDNFDAIVFIGGSGAQQYINDLVAHNLAREAVAKNKVLAAICLAPEILAAAGVLKGKNATVYPTEGEKLKSWEVNYTGKNIEIDGKIITADGPGSAAVFGEAISKALLGS